MLAKVNLQDFTLKSESYKGYLENHTFSQKKSGQPSEDIFMLLEINKLDPSASAVLSKDLFQKIKTTYLQEKEKSPYERLESALKEANEFLKSYPEDFQINSVIAVLSGEELHLSQTGYAEAYLFRSGSLTLISEDLYDDENEEEYFQNIASGILEASDRLVFSSEPLGRLGKKDEHISVLSLDSLKKVTLEFKDMSSLSGIENLNLLVFEVEELSPLPASESSSDPVSTPKPTKKNRKATSPLLEKAQQLARNLEAQGFSPRILISIAAALIIVLIFAFWFLRSNQQIDTAQRALGDTIHQIQKDLDEANNQSYKGDKEAASLLIASAEEDLQSIIELNPAQYREEIAELVDKVALTKDAIEQIIRIKEPNLLVDLSGLRENVQTRGLINADDGRKFIYDNNALYETILSETHEPLTIDPNLAIIDGINFSEAGRLAFLAKEGGIIEYRDGLFQFATTATESGWKPAVALDSWSNYLYLLDPSADQQGQIWKYELRSGTYQEPTPWNAEGDLTNAVDLSIDSDIWVLIQDGRIEHLRGGERIDTRITDAPSSPLSNPTRIFTGENYSSLYVLDPTNNRIMRYYKNKEDEKLEFMEQYVYGSLQQEVRDIYIDEEEKKLYLLTPTKLYEFEM